MNEDKLRKKFRNYMSYMYVLCISMDSYCLGHNLALDKMIINNIIYICFIVLFLYFLYKTIETEIKSSKKEFTVEIKNQFHINMQIIVVLSFLVGYIYFNQSAQYFIITAYSLINCYMLNRKVIKYINEKEK